MSQGIWSAKNLGPELLLHTPEVLETQLDKTTTALLLNR